MLYWILGVAILILLGLAVFKVRRNRRGKDRAKKASDIYPLW